MGKHDDFIKKITVSSKYTNRLSNLSMKSSYEKDLKSVNTSSNLYICILILIETASSQEVSNGTWKLE